MMNILYRGSKGRERNKVYEFLLLACVVLDTSAVDYRSSEAMKGMCGDVVSVCDSDIGRGCGDEQ